MDVNLREFSKFHDEYGYYPQGVSVSTGVFPSGWRERLVTFQGPRTEPGRGLGLEPHDCILAKLVPLDKKTSGPWPGYFARECVAEVIRGDARAPSPSFPLPSSDDQLTRRRLNASECKLRS